jgi:hypothetical protein
MTLNSIFKGTWKPIAIKAPTEITNQITIKQVFVGDTATSNDYLLYTIPVGYKLLLESAYLSGANAVLAAGGEYIRLNVRNTFILSLFINSGDTVTISQNYPTPIVLNAGEEIRVRKEADTAAYAGFSGYLVPENTPLGIV